MATPTRIGAYSPATARRIIAAIDTLEQSGLLKPDAKIPPPLRSRDPAFPPLKFRNDSGEEIPAYGCMQITGTERDGDVTYFVADKPASGVETKPVMFNLHNPIADDDYGLADAGVEVRALCDNTSAATGARFAPDPNSWQMTEDSGGAFMFVGPDEIDANAGRFLLVGGGTRLFRFTLNANLDTGTADADILQMDGTDTGIDANVLDPLGIFDTLTTGDAGLCLRQGGSYYVIQAPCPE